MSQGKKLTANTDYLVENIMYHLQKMRSPGVAKEDMRAATVASSLIGRGLKLSGLRMVYEDYKKAGGKKIEMLESSAN